jgi:SAM-dependent methyltransferase
MDGKVLNLGCGYRKMIGAINVDAYGEPDVKHDLDVVPYPWEDESIDGICAHHVFEHLTDWWTAFKECGRILKVGGKLEIKVPDASCDSALGYRDHHHMFMPYTFHGAYTFDGKPFRHGSNAWASDVSGEVPLMFVSWNQVPFKRYEWMIKWCPWLLTFCGTHLRNFIWEQIFIFEKIGGKDE